MLFVTREKFPTYRVDLTELFSAGICTYGVHIDWVMNSLKPGPTRVLECGKKERVFVGATLSGDGIVAKIINQLLCLIHDLRIWSICRGGSYNLIQVRDKFFASVIAILAARISRVPFLYWMSFPFPEADLNRAADKNRDLSIFFRLYYKLRGHLTSLLLYRLILTSSDHIFVQSDQMKESLIKKGVDRYKITPVPMGVSFYRLNETEIKPSEDFRLRGLKSVVYIGSLSRARRMEFLIRAFRLVDERVPKVVLVLVGDAKKHDMLFLKSEIERSELSDNIVLTGFLPPEETWAYIQTASVCVSPIPPNPIFSVGSPTKILEYMAWGKAVVASDHPDQTRVIVESSGGIVVPYEVNAFADGIIAFLGDDPKLAEAMGKRAKEYVFNNRSYEKLSKMLLKKYCTFLEQIERS